MSNISVIYLYKYTITYVYAYDSPLFSFLVIRTKWANEGAPLVFAVPEACCAPLRRARTWTTMEEVCYRCLTTEVIFVIMAGEMNCFFFQNGILIGLIMKVR